MQDAAPNRVSDAVLTPHTIQVGDDKTVGMYCPAVAEWVNLVEDRPDTPVKYCMFCGVKLKRVRKPSPAMNR